MNLGFDFRRGAATLPPVLDQMAARINVLWSKEHDPNSGRHTNITANSISVDSLTVNGVPITGGGSMPDDLTAKHLYLTDANPFIVLTETDAPVNQQRWVIQSDLSQLLIRTSSDDYGTQPVVMQFTRTGTTPGLTTLNTPFLLLDPITPQIGWRLTGGAVDEKLWKLYVAGKSLYLTMINDADTAASSVLTFTRATGYTPGVTTLNTPLAVSGNVYPTANQAQQCGIDTNQWSYVFSRWHVASSTGGHIFDNHGQFGMYYSAGYLRIGAVSDAIAIPYGSNTVVVQGQGQIVGGAIVWADAGATAITLRGRAADNISQIMFANNVGGNHYVVQCSAYGTLKLLAPSGWQWIVTDNTLNGHAADYFHIGNVARLYQVHSLWHNASYSGGFQFESRTDAGIYWDAAVGPVLKHSSNFTYYYGDRTDFYFAGWAGRMNLNGFGPYGNAMVSQNWFLGGPSNYWYQAYIYHGVVLGSDGNAKNILRDESLGLAFINRLQPVEYKYKQDMNRKARHGVVTQQVIEALEGVEFDGVDEASMGLNYTELIAPIIKAIQELDQKVERLSGGADANTDA